MCTSLVFFYCTNLAWYSFDTPNLPKSFSGKKLGKLRVTDNPIWAPDIIQFTDIVDCQSKKKTNKAFEFFLTGIFPHILVFFCLAYLFVSWTSISHSSSTNRTSKKWICWASKANSAVGPWCAWACKFWAVGIDFFVNISPIDLFNSSLISRLLSCLSCCLSKVSGFRLHLRHFVLFKWQIFFFLWYKVIVRVTFLSRRTC